MWSALIFSLMLLYCSAEWADGEVVRQSKQPRRDDAICEWLATSRLLFDHRIWPLIQNFVCNRATITNQNAWEWEQYWRGVEVTYPIVRLQILCPPLAFIPARSRCISHRSIFGERPPRRHAPSVGNTLVYPSSQLGRQMRFAS